MDKKCITRSRSSIMNFRLYSTGVFSIMNFRLYSTGGLLYYEFQIIFHRGCTIMGGSSNIEGSSIMREGLWEVGKQTLHFLFHLHITVSAMTYIKNDFISYSTQTQLNSTLFRNRRKKYEYDSCFRSTGSNRSDPWRYVGYVRKNITGF